MPRAAILTEMKPKGIVRRVIQELADASGAYIIVSSKGSVSDTALHSRRAAMTEAVRELPDVSSLHLDFYDRNRVASWVREHLGLAFWLREKIGQAIPGWRPYGPWAATSESTNAEYLLDEISHPISASILVPDLATTASPPANAKRSCIGSGRPFLFAKGSWTMRQSLPRFARPLQIVFAGSGTMSGCMTRAKTFAGCSSRDISGPTVGKRFIQSGDGGKSRWMRTWNAGLWPLRNFLPQAILLTGPGQWCFRMLLAHSTILAQTTISPLTRIGCRHRRTSLAETLRKVKPLSRSCCQNASRRNRGCTLGIL